MAPGEHPNGMRLSPSSIGRGEKSFPPSVFTKGGDACDIVIDAFRHPVAHMNSIELYTFAMVIIAVITLVVTIKRK